MFAAKKLSHRRKPVPMAEMDPGFRREDEDGRVAFYRPNDSEGRSEHSTCISLDDREQSTVLWDLAIADCRDPRGAGRWPCAPPWEGRRLRLQRISRQWRLAVHLDVEPAGEGAQKLFGDLSHAGSPAPHAFLALVKAFA